MKARFPLLKFQGISLLGLALSSMQAPGQEARPNIILILADDLGYSDIGCFGSEISTPSLDNLAENGMRMTQFYNASRSCPTRASLLTGLYQHQAGVGDMVSDLGFPSYQGYLNDNCITLAEALKSFGYKTFMSGKWHVGNRAGVHPMDRGFDRFFGIIDGGGSYFRRIAYRPKTVVPLWMLDRNDYTPADSGFYLTDAIADQALAFLDEDTGQEPFFLYLAFTAPHWPLHALPEDIAKYRGKYLEGWDALRNERYSRMLRMGIIDRSAKLSPRDKNSKEWNNLSVEEKEIWDLRMSVYAAMIDRMDRNIGKVMGKIEKMGEKNNTLVIFLSDNGGCHENTRGQAEFLKTKGVTGSSDSFDAYEYPWANASNTPFRSFKHWVHEGGVSTPFIIYYPAGIKPGQISRQPGHIIDIMPTLLDFAKGSYPSRRNGTDIPGPEGISLRPAFRGEPLNRKAPLFWEHEGNRAVRDGDWKLVSSYDYSKKKPFEWELYDMRNDRSELNDLSKKNPEIRYRMIEQYCEWAERVGVIAKERIDSEKQ